MPAPLLEAHITIDAPPATVWAIVSDMQRMGEFSPQCRYTRVRGDGRVAPGATTININRQGILVWPTTSRVLAVEPERLLRFRVRENRTEWSYRLEPTADGAGTVLTERREAPHGTSGISRLLVRTVFGGEAGFEEGLERGMAETLSKIKEAAER